MDATCRLVSYNVRYDTPADGEFDWERRRDSVVGTLAFHRADLIGLQEPLAHQFADVREALPEFEWFGTSRQAGEREGEFCPIGYRRDRFDRLESGTFWLSPTPDEPGSVGWDAARPRIATWLRATDRTTGDDVCLVNTHLDHEGEQARRESARLLLDRLPELRDCDAAIVAGDFNATPDDPAYARMTDGPLVDARDVSDRPWHGPDTTRTTFEALDPDRPIDHAFVDGMSVPQVGVATDLVGDGWYPSDHLPLVVDFDARGTGTR